MEENGLQNMEEEREERNKIQRFIQLLLLCACVCICICIYFYVLIINLLLCQKVLRLVTCYYKT